MNITITAYCACKKCCGRADGLTASGTIPVEGVTLAAPRRYKNLLGRHATISIKGYPTNATRRIEDLCGALTTSWDLFIRDHSRAKAFGRKTATLTIHEN